ncbi:MAG: hypothetical protein HY905_17230 [Deltaproteobacteria bacterium]|nr:hypothetical protein [Deltaproteobacteria bacterium]
MKLTIVPQKAAAPFVLLLIVSAGPGPAAAQVAAAEATDATGEQPVAAAPPIDLERVLEAVVEYDTPWASGYGLLVRDDRTVVFPEPGADAGRTITVHPVGHPESESDASEVRRSVVWDVDYGFFVLTLERPLAGRPLALAPGLPALGDRVYTLDETTGDDGETKFELVETRVTSVSASRFTLGMTGEQTFGGAPVLDAQGRIVGLVDWGTGVVGVSRLLEPESLQPRPMALLPVLGLRGYYQWGGIPDGTGGAVFELGISLWDQLGVVLDFGVNGGSGVHELRLDAPSATVGPGRLTVEDLGIDLGLELQYRLLLARWSMPLHLRFAAGVRYEYLARDPSGPAFYSGDPACDPSVPGAVCRLVSGPTPDDLGLHGVGLIVGADVTLGGFSVGYRFIPADVAYHLADTHLVLVGFSMF